MTDSTKRPDRPPLQPDAVLGQERQPGLLPPPVDSTEDVELLLPHEVVWLERQLVKGFRQDLGAPPRGLLLEPRLQLSVLRKVDPHLDVAAPEPDRIPRVADGPPPDVADVLPLRLEERVLSVGHEEDEEVLVSEVLNVREPRALPPVARPVSVATQNPPASEFRGSKP